MPLPKFGFASLAASELFLKMLNEATELYLSEHHDIWETINY